MTSKFVKYCIRVFLVIDAYPPPLIILRLQCFLANPLEAFVPGRVPLQQVLLVHDELPADTLDALVLDESRRFALVVGGQERVGVVRLEEHQAAGSDRDSPNERVLVVAGNLERQWEFRFLPVHVHVKGHRYFRFGRRGVEVFGDRALRHFNLSDEGIPC